MARVELVDQSCGRCGKEFQVPVKTGQYARRYCSEYCCYNGRRGTVEERFWAKVQKTPVCWLWMGNKNDWGYGHFWLNGKMVKAHRWSYEHHIGQVPPGKLLKHICDNPRCVRPDHLEPGTDAENMADSLARGRRGNCRGGRLDQDKAVALMHLLKTGMTQVQIAKVVGVSIKTVARHGKATSDDKQGS
jgi:hypothetical protein